MLTGRIWSWLHNKKHQISHEIIPAICIHTSPQSSAPGHRFNIITTQSNPPASIITRLKLLMAECYEWVCSQFCWTIWFSTCTESCTKGPTCNPEVALESQMMCKRAVFILWRFLQTHCRLISRIFSFKGKCSLHVPSFSSWDFKTRCPQHRNLLWMRFIAANNSRWADSPLNCSSNRLSGATCFDFLILFPPPLNKWYSPVITEANRRLR